MNGFVRKSLSMVQGLSDQRRPASDEQGLAGKMGRLDCIRWTCSALFYRIQTICPFDWEICDKRPFC